MSHRYRRFFALTLLGSSITGCGAESGDPALLPLPTSPSCVRECASVAAAGHEPRMLAVGKDRIYWTTLTKGIGTVQSAPLGGGEAQEIASFEAESISRIALDSAHVYWTESRQSGALRRALLDGGSKETLADGIQLLGSLVVDDESVYFTSFDRGCIAKVPLAGGQVTTMSELCPDTSHFLGALQAVDDDQIYVATSFFDASTVWTVPLGEGGPRELPSIDGELRGFAAGPEAVYLTVLSNPPLDWDGRTESSAWMIPKTGTDAPSKVTVLQKASGIAADESGVYFTDAGEGTLLRASLDGTSLETLASGLDTPTWVALDAGHVYWSHWTAAGKKPTISRMPKGPSSPE